MPLKARGLDLHEELPIEVDNKQDIRLDTDEAKNNYISMRRASISGSDTIRLLDLKLSGFRGSYVKPVQYPTGWPTATTYCYGLRNTFTIYY